MKRQRKAQGSTTITQQERVKVCKYAVENSTMCSYQGLVPNFQSGWSIVYVVYCLWIRTCVVPKTAKLISANLDFRSITPSNISGNALGLIAWANCSVNNIRRTFCVSNSNQDTIDDSHQDIHLYSLQVHKLQQHTHHALQLLLCSKQWGINYPTSQSGTH